MNFAQLKFFLTGLTFLLMLNACSDDNTSTEAPLQPSKLQSSPRKQTKSRFD